jgi:hypothetical protein
MNAPKADCATSGEKDYSTAASQIDGCAGTRPALLCCIHIDE